MNKKYLGLLLAIVVIALSLIFPPMFGLTELGQKTLGVLLAGLILWILEILPFGVTGLLVIVLQPILNIADAGTAFANFANPTVFFVMATFGLSLAILNTDLGYRLIRSLLKISGNDSQKILLAFMVATAILSSIMSNVPVTAMFAGLAAGMLDKMGKEKKDLLFGKAIMLAIPFAGMIGGSMTPAGSSINVLALDLLERYSGIRVGFVDWMMYGIPVVLFVLPLCWFVMIKIFKPEDIDKSIVDSFMDNKRIPSKFSLNETKVLVIISIMVTLWILSTWVPILNTTVVAVAGLILFFLPGIEVFTWKQFTSGVSWDTVIMIGGVLSIGAAAIEAGLGEWFLGIFLQYFLQLNLVSLLVILGIIIAILHLPLPLAPAIVAVAAGPLYGLALQMGIPPELLIIPLAIFSSCCMLVPLDPVPVITYSYGYYNMKNMFVSGSITTLIWVALLSLWVPVAGKLLNVY